MLSLIKGQFTLLNIKNYGHNMKTGVGLLIIEILDDSKKDKKTLATDMIIVTFVIWTGDEV